MQPGTAAGIAWLHISWVGGLRRGCLASVEHPYATIIPVSDFKPRPGTFLPYMEYKQKMEEQQPKASPLALLEILSRQGSQSLPIFELQAQSGMEPSRYGDALKSLRAAEYIAIEGEAPEQTVQLTSQGAQVVRLAKPA
ncbi:MAG: hypothetical protein JOZ22_22600 [Acidobacteriia bacterium]|nr:hypothetical protein [Terriglobia bacterium]